MREKRPCDRVDAFVVQGDHPVAPRGDAVAAEERAQLGGRVTGLEQHEHRRARRVPVFVEDCKFLVREVILGGHQCHAFRVGGDFLKAGKVDALELDVLKLQGVLQRPQRRILALGAQAVLVREVEHLAGAAFDRLDQPRGQHVLALESGDPALGSLRFVNRQVLGDDELHVRVEDSVAVLVLGRNRAGVGAGVHHDQVLGQRQPVSGGDFLRAVGTAQRIDDLQLDLPAGKALVFLGQRADPLVKRRAAAEGHDPLDRILALLERRAFQIGLGRWRERVSRLAAQIDALVVVRCQVVQRDEDHREQDDLDHGKRAQSPAVQRAGGFCFWLGSRIGHGMKFNESAAPAAVIHDLIGEKKHEQREA